MCDDSSFLASPDPWMDPEADAPGDFPLFTPLPEPLTEEIVEEQIESMMQALMSPLNLSFPSSENSPFGEMSSVGAPLPPFSPPLFSFFADSFEENSGNLAAPGHHSPFLAQAESDLLDVEDHSLAGISDILALVQAPLSFPCLPGELEENSGNLAAPGHHSPFLAQAESDVLDVEDHSLAGISDILALVQAPLSFPCLPGELEEGEPEESGLSCGLFFLEKETIPL